MHVQSPPVDITPKELVDLSLEDFVPNPFHAGHLRNKLCPCLSNKKLKKCHGAGSHIRKGVLEKLMLVLETNAATEQQV